MTRNVEELLRQGLDQLAADHADPEVPASLLRRARRHNRRRREAIAGTLAAGGAAIAAVATFLTTAAPVVSVSGQTITYVTTRTERALAQLDPSKAIEQDTLTARNGYFNFTVLNTAVSAGSPQVSGVLATVRASSEVDWLYQGQLLQQGFSAAGKLVYTSTEGPHGVTGAAFPAQVRWHNPLTGGQSGPNPPLTCDRAVNGYPSWRQSIKKVLSCHLFTLAGNQTIGGVDTIKLVGKPITAEGQTFRQTLWIDPRTYLPLQTSTTFSEPQHRVATLTTGFRWLSPTQANLGTLHTAEQRGAIPASFRPLPSTYLPLPGFAGPAR